MRVDDLLREVDAFLDRHFAEGAVDAVILHGHGTGALKEALRVHLKGSPYVGAFRRGDPQEGGDAVTVCAFRR
jgi:DNA mismatch repair protein MutS2